MDEGVFEKLFVPRKECVDAIKGRNKNDFGG